MSFLINWQPFYHSNLMVHALKCFDWNPTKSSILSQGVNKARVIGCGKIDRGYTGKVPLGHYVNCLFWSNCGHSTKRQLYGSCSEICLETQQNLQFLANEATDLIFLITASSAGSIRRRHHLAIMSNIFFGRMAAIVGTASSKSRLVL
jgi:hypothetical protein